MRSAPKHHRDPLPILTRVCICTVFLTVTPAHRSRLGQRQSCLIREALSGASNGGKKKKLTLTLLSEKHPNTKREGLKGGKLTENERKTKEVKKGGWEGLGEFGRGGNGET